jgi:8-oxo-dGTP pyrophosphatase MutT (NUDIX family)
MSLRDDLFQRFSTRESQNLKLQLSDYACVAVILRGSSWEDLEVGYIQRAIHPDDNWSGQLAFPGGRNDSRDINDFATAVRETQEEVGIELTSYDLLGSLNDIQGRKAGQLLNFFIRPFVFYIDREVEPRLDPTEVADFFWVPLENLSAPERQIQYALNRDGVNLSLPAIQLGKEPVLWGLTYVMTQDLLKGLITA